MLTSLLRLLDEKIVFPARYKRLTNRLTPYLQNSHRVLDVGSSDGKLATHLHTKTPFLEFTGVDVVVQPHTSIATTKYDGRHLPFNDASFDTVLIVDVLHHDTEPLEILKEAARVSSKFVLVRDHYWENEWDQFILKLLCYLGSKPYGIPMPYAFLQLSQYEKMFTDLELRIVKTERYFTPPRRAKNVTFLLEKS